MSYQATETEKKCKECDSFISLDSIFGDVCSGTCNMLTLFKRKLHDEQIRRGVTGQLLIRVVTASR